MAESSLSVALPELRSAVGFFLGYGRGVAKAWTATQSAEIDLVVQSGVRRVYYPSAVDARIKGVQEGIVGYEWSWLRPCTTLPIVASTYEYDLPDNFGRLNGQLHYPAETHKPSIVVVSASKILEYKSISDSADYPRYAATRYKSSTGSTGQRQEILFYPTPSVSLSLSYEYDAYSGALTDTFPYPLGGMQLSELYIESCLAIAESRIDDTMGTHTEQFQYLLIDAVVRDKKRGAQSFGQMGDITVESEGFTRAGCDEFFDITYNDEVI
jgi:hypothetical protein